MLKVDCEVFVVGDLAGESNDMTADGSSGLDFTTRADPETVLVRVEDVDPA